MSAQAGAETATYNYAVLLGFMDLCLEGTSRAGAAPLARVKIERLRFGSDLTKDLTCWCFLS